MDAYVRQDREGTGQIGLNLTLCPASGVPSGAARRAWLPSRACRAASCPALAQSAVGLAEPHISTLRAQMISAGIAKAITLVKGNRRDVGSLRLQIEMGAALGSGPRLDRGKNRLRTAVPSRACARRHALHRSEPAVSDREPGADHDSSTVAGEIAAMGGEASEDGGRDLASVGGKTRNIDRKPVRRRIRVQLRVGRNTHRACNLLCHRDVTLAALVAHHRKPRVEITGPAHLGDREPASRTFGLIATFSVVHSRIEVITAECKRGN